METLDRGRIRLAALLDTRRPMDIECFIVLQRYAARAFLHATLATALATHIVAIATVPHHVPQLDLCLP
jgi:hypothetical protein